MKKLVVLLILLAGLLLSGSYASSYSLQSLAMGDVFNPFTGRTSQIFYNPVVSTDRGGGGYFSLSNLGQNQGYPYDTFSTSLYGLGSLVPKLHQNIKGTLLEEIIIGGSNINGKYQLGTAVNWGITGFGKVGLGYKYFDQKGYFDVGLVRHPDKSNLALSFSALNLGENNTDLPQELTANVAYSFYDKSFFKHGGKNSWFELSTIIAEEKVSGGALTSHFGLEFVLGIKELVFPRLLFCRMGWNSDHPTVGLSSPIPLSRYTFVYIDFAWDFKPNDHRALFGVSL